MMPGTPGLRCGYALVVSPLSGRLALADADRGMGGCQGTITNCSRRRRIRSHSVILRSSVRGPAPVRQLGQSAVIGAIVVGVLTGPLLDKAAGETFRPYPRSGVLMCCGRPPLLEFCEVWFVAVSVINHSLA